MVQSSQYEQRGGPEISSFGFGVEFAAGGIFAGVAVGEELDDVEVEDGTD